MSVGERIRSLRENEGITQSQLARRIQTERATVNAWEMGLCNPNMMSIVDLADYFHVSADFLLEIEQTERIAVDRLNTAEKQFIIGLIRYFENTARS